MSYRERRRPHVLTLIDGLGPGGAEQVAEELLAGIDPARFRLSVCVTRSTDALPQAALELSLRRLRDAGVGIISLDRRARRDIGAIVQLARLLRSGDVDLVHAHKFGSNVWAAALGHLCGVPGVIAHEHTWSFEGQLGRRLIDRNVVARFSDAVVAVSEADRSRMISIVGMPEDRVTLIPNGIPEPRRGDHGSIRRELGLSEELPLLVQTAVLRPQKAIGTMLGAIAALRRRDVDARLLVVGPGDADPLQKLAGELSVADSVSFLGQRNDVGDILADADVGVLSSDFEGMPLAVLEYMAAGLPVVSTAVGGVPEIIRDGETGFLAPRGDSRALADLIARLLADPALAKRMGESGRRLQQARFSARAMIDDVTALYERLLAAKGVPAFRAADSPRRPKIPASA